MGQETGKLQFAEQQFLSNKVEPSPRDVANLVPSLLWIPLPIDFD
jgi:hypothetical protein